MPIQLSTLKTCTITTAIEVENEGKKEDFRIVFQDMSFDEANKLADESNREAAQLLEEWRAIPDNTAPKPPTGNLIYLAKRIVLLPDLLESKDTVATVSVELFQKIAPSIIASIETAMVEAVFNPKLRR